MSKAKEIAEYLDYNFLPSCSDDFNLKLSNKVTEASNELRRLSDLNEKMLIALEKAKGWHYGDKWRESDDPTERAAWDSQLLVLEMLIKKAKEQG